MKKLYIIGPEDNGEGVYHLISEDGEHLASHYCSSSGYAAGDLEGNRDERKNEFIKRFGTYQVLFISRDAMTRERLKELNKEWYDKS